MNKCWIVMALVIGVNAMSDAQQIQFDNFESYKLDSMLQVTNSPYWFPGFGDEERRPYIRSSGPGLLPYSGKQMVELRAAAFGGYHAIATNGLFHTDDDIVIFRARWAVASATFEDQVLGLSIMDNLGVDENLGTTTFDINLRSGEITRGQMTFYKGSISLDEWHSFEAVYDWKADWMNVSIDGKEFYRRSLAGKAPGFPSPRLSVFNNQDLSAKYPFEFGSPGVFVDDFTLAVVPEPSSVAALLASAGVMTIIRRKNGKIA